jgi:hypothetical protein
MQAYELRGQFMNDRCEIWTGFSIGRMPALRHAMAAVVAAGTAWAAFFLIDPVKQPLLPPCLFHAFTGLCCPGCGATRALHQLAHGHMTAALRLNALAVLVLPLGCLLAVCRKRRDLPARCLWALLVCVAAFGIARNIPLFPFTLLAP